MAHIFTADLVMRAIKICRNSKVFGPDKLSIFHLKQLGPGEVECITALFNLAVIDCWIPDTWKSLLIILIPNPGKDTTQRTYYWPLSLLFPAGKILETLCLPTINKYLLSVPDKHGFRPEHSTPCCPDCFIWNCS